MLTGRVANKKCADRGYSALIRGLKWEIQNNPSICVPPIAAKPHADKRVIEIY